MCVMLKRVVFKEVELNIIKLEEIIAVQNKPDMLHVVYRGEDGEKDIYIIDKSQEPSLEQQALSPGKVIEL